MQTLSKDLRRTLENTVKEARRVAEEGARKAIESLAVHHHEPWTGLTSEQRALRNRLRAHGRQLGDKRDERRGTQVINCLVSECAYEHWHRMLFARFLAENNLLIEPSTGIAITLQECQELAREQSEDWLELASGFAEGMLPQIFRQDDPVLDVTLPAETRSKLESKLEALPYEIFLADDSLGWVYQFWQSEKKDEINRSEKKIGADELSAVTQLFTEDYMVLFLLHNTLGAWWAGKVLAANPKLVVSAKSEDELRAACSVGDIKWDYLRFIKSPLHHGDNSAPIFPLPQGEDTTSSPSPLTGEGQGEGEVWRPAAGAFEGWPREAKKITMLDPCMGSGHFIVFAFPILVAFRMAEEGLSEADAIDAVLRENLFGLEIDSRCTQIAAFNLALSAWRRVGYRPLPQLNLACSGLSLGVSRAEWEKLAEHAAASSPVPPEQNLFGTIDNIFSSRIKDGLMQLYDLFSQAPTLGSLINPQSLMGTIFAADFAQLEPVFSEILRATHTDELAEMAVAAQGMAKAADILAGKFTLVATNVPYLTRQRQCVNLRDHCERVFPTSKADIASCFIERGVAFLSQIGTLAVVAPTNWLYQPAYKHFRRQMLTNKHWHAIARLGAGAFDGISGEIVNVTLVVIGNDRKDQAKSSGFYVDATAGTSAMEKVVIIRSAEAGEFNQTDQLSNPDGRVILGKIEHRSLLYVKARSLTGLRTADNPQFSFCFWEVHFWRELWVGFQSTVEDTKLYGGKEHILRWNSGSGTLRDFAELGLASIQGRDAWGKRGVTVSLMSNLPVTLYSGDKYDMNCGVLWPHTESDLPAVWAYCSSHEFSTDVRKIDQQLKLTTATLLKIPFDLVHWQKVAAEKYPNGLPKPFSSDPTQWIFSGHPKDSLTPDPCPKGRAEQVLQVALARLLGYQWPRQTGSSFLDCPALGSDALEKHADADGIVCLNPLRGEHPADQRLIAILADAFGAEWSAGKLASMFTEASFEGKVLDDWLRDGFFEQHCTIFHQRPFIWHIWDGRRDGFHVLINYHKLAAPNGEGKRTLETLIYTYLGDWIDRQRADQKAGIEGADGRVASAMHLKNELENILTGEPPSDIFVRWKPIHKQAIGWEPDINDGVRLNIRPFMTAKPMGSRAKGACILRATPKIKWEKDRGKEPNRAKDDFPWFWGWDEQTQDFTGNKDFDGNRYNDLHYTIAFKQDARVRKK